MKAQKEAQAAALAAEKKAKAAAAAAGNAESPIEISSAGEQTSPIVINCQYPTVFCRRSHTTFTSSKLTMIFRNTQRHGKTACSRPSRPLLGWMPQPFLRAPAITIEERRWPQKAFCGAIFGRQSRKGQRQHHHRSPRRFGGEHRAVRRDQGPRTSSIIRI